MASKPSERKLFISHWGKPVLVDLGSYPESFAFPDIDSIPLPASVRQRIHLLDLIEPTELGVSSLASACPGVHGIRTVWGPLYGDSKSCEGRWVYKLRLTQTEYDQLLAALGGEDNE